MAKALAFYNVANDTLGTLGEGEACKQKYRAPFFTPLLTRLFSGYRSDPKMIKIQSLIEERLAMAADEGWSDDRSDHDSDISIPRRRASHSSSDPRKKLILFIGDLTNS